MTPVIFINTTSSPFVDDIIDGRKTYETRTRNTLKSLLTWALGERILIAETGHGDPVVRCSAVIDYIPPCNAHHGLDAEPKAIEITGNYRLDPPAAIVIAGRRDCNFT